MYIYILFLKITFLADQYLRSRILENKLEWIKFWKKMNFELISSASAGIPITTRLCELHSAIILIREFKELLEKKYNLCDK